MVTSLETTERDAFRVRARMYLQGRLVVRHCGGALSADHNGDMEAVVGQSGSSTSHTEGF